MKHKYTIKQILTGNQAWWAFAKKHQDKLRAAIPLAIVKLLSCKNVVRGFSEYCCSNKNCTNTKRICFTCKSKGCSSCGKKQTMLWLAKNNNILPDTSWQHITFTMPDIFWDFFWCNRYLLNEIAKLAAQCVQSIANDKKLTPGIFIAIHTFGRDLKRNVHIHLSVTLGGLSLCQTKWAKLSFSKTLLMSQWKYKIINMFRIAYKQSTLTIPPKIQQQLNHTFTFNNFLDKQYNRYWHVHCSQPSKNHKKDMEYLARYIKRPPIAESRLKHYDGNNVVFEYLDHKTKQFKKKRMSVDKFIGKFVSHIPDVGFRMIRYYGFLSNRLRGDLLPVVQQVLGQEKRKELPPPSFSQLMIQNFNFDPLECILCGYPMRLTGMIFGITNPNKLLQFHKQLALLQKI